MPVKVELVGMLPEFYQMCARSSAVCDLEPTSEQLRDYPPDVQATQSRFAEMYSRLLTDFGDRAIPVSVGLMSPRGFWLTLRHRLGQDPAVVINGETVIPLSRGYEAVRQAVGAALRE